MARMFATELQGVDASAGTASAIPLSAGTALAGLGHDLAGDGSTPIVAALYTSSAKHELGQYVDWVWSIYHGCATYAVSMSVGEVASGPG